MKLFPYIYEPDKSIEVYKRTEQYFSDFPEIKERIEQLGWTYHTIGMVVPQTMENFWSGHFFPFKESWDELQISFNLVCFGLYKQAFASLRSGLELGLLSVYYNIDDNGHNVVKDWLSSKDTKEANTPRTDIVWNILLSNPNIKKFNDQHNLKEKFSELSFLHNYVHTKGAKYSNTFGILKTNSQTFESNLLDKWLKCYVEITSIVCSLHLLKYPISVIRFDYTSKFGIDIPNFGGLEEFNIDKFDRILPEGYMQSIEEIAKEDISTQEILQGIKEMPDMTEEGMEEQVIALEKIFIPGQGFPDWLETQKKIYSISNDGKFSAKMEKRIEILRLWAVENDHMESIIVKNGWKINEIKNNK